MKIKEVTDFLESLAPLALQESYDNSGLIVGDRLADVTGVLVSLDCTEAIIDEAVKTGCNLVVSHHPIVFSGLKKITGKNYVERTIIAAIKNNVAIYAIHTNLDNVYAGVNAKIAAQLGLKNTKILAPKNGLLRKFVTFCPAASAEKVREALWEAGAGYIGNYDKVSYNLEGTGTYRGNENSNPVVGEKGKLMREPEERIEIIFPAHIEADILAALRASHPYEEIAYDIFPLTNDWQQVGSGMIGELAVPLDQNEFLGLVKTTMNTPVIRYTPVPGKKIVKVAVCGGSGSFLLAEAMRKGADAFVTADFKYHQFFDGEGKILVADIGHFESEQFTIDLLVDQLKGIITTFAVRKTEINTNPITYYI
ncbi:MAG TPA: Nif3-like dinuclear metal center hexameric protein [Bacteroidia bacterium]|nr:Nif3-like dinuclear metal center hexameric protein [Bacteroidia bacterium]